ncbi:MAG: TOPRIM nucleotidyl transferase/hydrolase domain-containing protein [Desulfobacteria bacterium]
MPDFLRVHQDFDLDNERISIISTGSSDNITYLYVMFNEFHIPCYIIFDGDKPNISLDKLTGKEKDDAKNKSRRNKELLEFIGEQADEDGDFFFPETSVKEKYAVWGKNFEDVFHMTLENYEEIKEGAYKLYGTKSKPLTGRYFAEELTSKFPEKISPYVDNLIEKIKGCCWKESCLGKG